MLKCIFRHKYKVFKTGQIIISKYRICECCEKVQRETNFGLLGPTAHGLLPRWVETDKEVEEILLEMI